MPDAAAEAAVEAMWAPIWASARAALDAEAAAPAAARPAWAWPVAGALGGTAAAIVLALTPFLLVPALPRARFGALPWLATPPRRVAAALAALRPDVLRGRVFVDLGAGDGAAVLAAARAGALARGVELNPTLVMWARMRPAPAPAPAFHLGDLFAHDIRDADVLMLYGVVPLMPRLAAKIEAEAKPGVVVISHRFALPPAWAPHLRATVDSMHIYCRDGNPLLHQPSAPPADAAAAPPPSASSTELR